MVPPIVVTEQLVCRLQGDGPTARDLRQLVEAAKDGDKRAWEEIYVALYSRLLAYARHHLGPDSAADAVSDAMVKALTSIKRFSWRQGGFEAWMFRILRNVIVDNHRRNGRARREIRQAAVDQHDESVDRLVAHEETAALRSAFGRLDPDEQDLLQLRVVAGLSSEEVAHVLGKRAGAVRMAQSRSLEHLRTLLAQEGGR